MGNRRIIVVLGMHRSGTSVTTNLLSELGVPLSDDLMPATDANQRGYFESVEIAKIHDTILEQFSLKWNTPTTLRPLPPGWWRLPSVLPYREKLKNIVLTQLATRPLWAFKDPRTARLLPLWKDLTSELGIEATFMLVTRHPSEVAGSLLTRDQMDPLFAELLWLEHNAEVLNECGTHLAAIIDYQRWMERPFEQAKYMIQRLSLPYGGTDEDLRALLDRVVAKDLRHHGADRVCRLPFSAPMYAALSKRDTQAVMQLCEIFNISKGFAGAIASRLHDRLAEVSALADRQAMQLQGLEQQVRMLDHALTTARSAPL